MDVTFETPQGRRFNIQIWYFSTVRRIKEYILQHEGIPMLFFDKVKMEEGKGLAMYNCLSIGWRSTSLSLTHLNTKHGGKRASVILEVSNLNVVKDLWMKLCRVAPHFLQPVDGGGYYFVYRQNVMDEDRTLC
ncbi:hypothetical protein BAE44_0020743 [Dichanthelium oligosanthes]|uniref:Ubiquitin-like domain-containing protein n=1 Tax=Dichanthelium oligosanthes TaxID=888268 RepID=A0A1E5UZC4_9POAL|nr:hypothetical protein BAE44_0020743 [Dichanthelium oligosanthes]